MKTRTWTRPIGLVLAFVLLTPSQMFAGSPAPSDTFLAAGAAEDPRVEASALQFRQTFGLEADLEYIRSAARNPEFSVAEYGVPLSKTELAEMFRRAEVQASLEEASDYARADPTFAGVFIDQHLQGQPVFMFTADRDDRHGEIAKRLPAQTAFLLASATRTEAELYALQEDIDSAREALNEDGIEVVMTAIDIRRNSVVVGVQALSASAQDEIIELYGPGVLIREASDGQADACNTYDCRPIKGGLAIYRRSSTFPCTSGFVVNPSNSTSVHLLTAGHCLAIGDVDEIWDHNQPADPNDSFGRSQFDTWNVGATRDADVGLISVFTAEQPTTKNQIYTGNGRINAVTYSVPTIYQSVGYQICRYGEHQGQPEQLKCGVIELLNGNNSKASTVPNVGTMQVKHTISVSFDSIGGDSGGPMFAYLSGGIGSTNPVAAYGTHVHSDPDNAADPKGWYSPIDWGRATYPTYSGGITYTVCVNASCT